MAVKKVTVNLPEDQVRFLQEIAAREHMTFTDVLRRAINSEKFFVQQEQAGRKVLVEESGQRIREVVRK
jgi:predicted transcriptional regulator